MLRELSFPRLMLLALGIILIFSIQSNGQVNPLLTLSCGYGQSFGGFGVSGQINPIPEIGLHAGVGYFPASSFFPEYDFVEDAILFNVGIRAYAPLEIDPIYLYGDLLFGGLGVQAEQWYFYDYWSGDYYYYEESEVLIGPSALVGGEIRFELSDNIAGGFMGALGLAYALNDIDWLDQEIFLTLDVGVCLYITRP